MPDFPRIKTIADPEAIWTYKNRTLTSLTGQPRIDLLGEDASFEDGIGIRKKLIDRIANIDVFDIPIEGVLTANGTEQTLVLDEVEGNPLRYLEGFISLREMDENDEIEVKYYICIQPPDYELYYSQKITKQPDAQVIWVTTKPTKYGLKITLQQLSGTYKSFKYIFFRRRVL